MPGHPIAVVRRHERPRPPVWATGFRNVRPIVALAPQRAPERPRDGDTPARPARMPITMFTAIRAHKAVARDSFFVRMRSPAPRPSMPRGRQAPWKQRGNIRHVLPPSYGSQFVLAPQGMGLVPQVFAGMP